MFDKDNYEITKIRPGKWEVSKKEEYSGTNPWDRLIWGILIAFGIIYLVPKLLSGFHSMILGIFGGASVFVYLMGFILLCGIVAIVVMDSSSDIPHDKDKSDIF